MSPFDSTSFALAGQPVLVATDGSPAAMASVRIALALERTHGALVHVVTVIDSSAASMPAPLGLAIALGDAIAGAAVHETQERALRAKLSAEIGEPIDWPVRIVMGTPAGAIVRAAQSLDAALIVMGLRRHGPIDRVVNDETARNVMQRAPCPVLGVVAGATGLPNRILAALDFSSTSLAAARAARAIVGEPAHMVLAYTAPATQSGPDDGEQLIHDLGVDAALAKTAKELAGAAVTFDTVVLHHQRPGSPAVLLLEAAEDAKCDLIAAGSARHGRIERWLLGSVSAEIVRDGRFSVMVVPPPHTAKG
ncbi:MAG: universal stress protein [Gemmatimonadaceae bacterium]